MNILVVGAGMYVTGRHTSGPGSALGSIGELSKTLDIDAITVVSKSESSLKDVNRARDVINKGCKHREAIYNEINATEIVGYIIDKFNGELI